MNFADKKYTLKIYPDSMLRKRALPVDQITGLTKRLIKIMCNIMYGHRAIGLAAPQIGISERIIIADTGEGLTSMINPEIFTGFGTDQLEEGCLSLPGIRINVDRNENLVLRYIDSKEKEVEKEFYGLTARVIQHEIDHLNGILIIDYEPISDRLTHNIKGSRN